MMFDINRPGRTILVMRISPMLIVAIGVTTFAAITLPTICQGDSSTNEDHKSYNCEYFQNVGFHLVLLFPLNLPGLDGAVNRRVYMGFAERI
jgi:hypothetical protein